MNRRKGYLVLMMFFVVVVLTACNQGKSASNTALPGEAGAVALYKKQCLSCHAADLSGRVGPSLQHIGSNMTKEELLGIIQGGAVGMPAFNHILNGEEMEALAQWLSIHK
ncbi:c-type cytochrome [Paenibacillus sp. FSL H8-0034]|uniref:c-type cytochrome n=1 Tax=Paenibacillus sp. FSL H8-0034 TaxID=2954671 RepID=UPI0030FC9E30